MGAAPNLSHLKIPQPQPFDLYQWEKDIQRFEDPIWGAPRVPWTFRATSVLIYLFAMGFVAWAIYRTVRS